MTFNQFLLVGIIPVFSACSSSDYQEGPFVSPSRKYNVEARVNRTDDTKATYASVRLILFDAANHKIDSVASGAGDFSKWALGWMPTSDTLVLHSSDIGPSAWSVDPSGRLKKLEFNSVSAALHSRIQARATELKDLKSK